MLMLANSLFLNVKLWSLSVKFSGYNDAKLPMVKVEVVFAVLS